MATQDDDDAPIPGPETEPTPAELAHARRFADLVDKTLAGRTPPAVSADDRALLEVATVIRATHGSLELAPGKRRSVVEDALRQAIGSAPASRGAVTPIARARAQRLAPWLVAGAASVVAVAAVALLWLRVPVGGGGGGVDQRSARRAPVPEEWTSRPADALVGPIARDRAGDASARIDTIFADRLDGFRSRRLARRGKP
jgi:hypothetical protein